MWRILQFNILIFLITITTEIKAQNQIVADLSQENVKISTTFLGAKILLFGAYDGIKGDDIIVVVTGPKGLVTVQKKEKIFGIWVNTKTVNYINTPKYLSISSNRNIDKILNQKTQKISEIGYLSQGIPKSTFWFSIWMKATATSKFFCRYDHLSSH